MHSSLQAAVGSLLLLCPLAFAGQSDLSNTLVALENRAYAAWQKGDETFFASNLSAKFVAWGPTGRLEPTQAAKSLSGAGCRIESYRLSAEQLTQLTPTVALLTHRTDVTGSCTGKPLAPNSSTATVFVQEAGQWKIAFRAQSAIVDPLKATQPANSAVWTSGATRTDANTKTLLAREIAVVNAWKDHDPARMGKLFGENLQFIDIFGTHIANRADALKAWSGEGCDVKSFEFTGAQATMFSPSFGILTYRADYKGSCFGQQLWPIWGTAMYVKQGKEWLWSSGINVLAGSLPR